MRFTTAVVPLSVLATQVAGQLSVLQGVLTDVQANVEAYGQAFTAGDAAAIESTADELLAGTLAGVATVNGASEISLIDAITLRATIEELQNAVEETYGTAVAQKEAVDGLGITNAVREDFLAQQTSVGTLGAAIVDKIPALVQSVAQTYVDNIDGIIADAIAAYES